MTSIVLRVYTLIHVFSGSMFSFYQYKNHQSDQTFSDWSLSTCVQGNSEGCRQFINNRLNFWSIDFSWHRLIKKCVHQCILMLFCGLATRERCLGENWFLNENVCFLENCCLSVNRWIDGFDQSTSVKRWGLILAAQETRRSTLRPWRKPWTPCAWGSRPCTTLSTWPYRLSSQCSCCPVSLMQRLLSYRLNHWLLFSPAGTCRGTQAGRSSSSSAVWPRATRPTSTSWLRKADTRDFCLWRSPVRAANALRWPCLPSNRLWSRSRCGCPSSACRRRCACARCWRGRRAALTTSSWMRGTSKSYWCCTSNLRRPARRPNAPWYAWVGTQQLWRTYPNGHVIRQ